MYVGAAFWQIELADSDAIFFIYVLSICVGSGECVWWFRLKWTQMTENDFVAICFFLEVENKVKVDFEILFSLGKTH